VTGRSVPPPEGRPPHDFDAIYAIGTPAWDIGRPQPAFDHLATAGKLVGRVLDVGCGTGEHALMAASLGHEAVGIDMSQRAVELAKTKATERGVDVRFVVADALRLVDLGEQFDTVLDCGLFQFSMTASASATSAAWLMWYLRVVAITCSASATASQVTGGHVG
jgi:SAM-dependent methyltransferase